MTDNAIEALRVLQVGVEGVKAQGTLTLATQPTAADTMTIGAIVYTFRAPGVLVAGEISIGTNLATAKTALLAAMDGTDGHNDPNPLVTFSAFTVDVSTISARVPGPVGNSIILAETFTAVGNVFNTTNPGVLGVTTAGSMARGTAVAATSRLAVEQLEWSADDENEYHPKVPNGILMRYTQAGTPVQHGTRFSLAQQAAIWEQLPLWFSMTLGAPVITGSLGGPYTMTWTVAPNTNPNPYAVTLERRFSNGLGNNIDENAAYCMLVDLGLSFAVNEELKLTGGTGFARKFATMGGGITSALTLPDFEVMVSALSTVYLDSLWANAGDTLLAEQVIGWNWKFLSGIFPRPTAEGRSDLSFTKHQINGGERGIDLSLTCLLDPTTYAAEATRAATPATNQFAVRVKVEGSDSRLLTIDQMMQHAKPLPPISVDQGQDVVTFDLLDCTDGTNALVVALTLPSLPVLA
jgi:hypothetical protein